VTALSIESREIDGQLYQRVVIAEAKPGSVAGAAFLAEIAPATEIEAPAPVFANSLPYQFSWWGKIFYATPEAYQRALPLQLFTAEGAVVVGYDAGLELPDGRYDEPSLRYLKPHLAASLFRQADGNLWVRAQPQIAAPPGKYFLGFNPEWQNYAHLLTDTLPLLFYYRRNLYDDCRLVVPPASPGPIHKKLLDLLGIDSERLYVMPHQRVRFDQILFTTQISLWSQTGLLNPAVDALIEAALGPHKTNEAPPMRRLYLSREDIQTRRLLNEPTLVKHLEKLGFEVVNCSALSVEQQVSLFRQAEIVVAPHGAALGNVLFCRSETAVLELFPEYCVQPHFRMLAAQRKLRYGYIVGTSFEHESSRAVQNSWSSDFVVDDNLVIRAVITMLDTKAGGPTAVRFAEAAETGGDLPAATRR